MKPEGVTGWGPELNHGTLQGQPANQREGIWLSWKLRNYIILRAISSGPGKFNWRRSFVSAARKCAERKFK